MTWLLIEYVATPFRDWVWQSCRKQPNKSKKRQDKVPKPVVIFHNKKNVSYSYWLPSVVSRFLCESFLKLSISPYHAMPLPVFLCLGPASAKPSQINWYVWRPWETCDIWLLQLVKKTTNLMYLLLSCVAYPYCSWWSDMLWSLVDR